MGVVKFFTSMQSVSPDDLPRYLSQFLDGLKQQINGGLEFNYNLRSSTLLTGNFIKADTDLNIPHNLGRLPQGFIVINATAAMSVYQGQIAWTTQNIFLRSNAVGTAMFYVI